MLDRCVLFVRKVCCAAQRCFGRDVGHTRSHVCPLDYDVDRFSLFSHRSGWVTTILKRTWRNLANRYIPNSEFGETLSEIPKTESGETPFPPRKSCEIRQFASLAQFMRVGYWLLLNSVLIWNLTEYSIPIHWLVGFAWWTLLSKLSNCELRYVTSSEILQIHRLLMIKLWEGWTNGNYKLVIKRYSILGKIGMSMVSLLDSELNLVKDQLTSQISKIVTLQDHNRGQPGSTLMRILEVVCGLRELSLVIHPSTACRWELNLLARCASRCRPHTRWLLKHRCRHVFTCS